MKSNFEEKWSRLFASKRFHTKDGVIKLTPEDQQELLDDAKMMKPSNVLERLINEREELDKKITDLSEALNKEGFNKVVGDYQFELLGVQHSAMLAYSKVLNMRINDLKHK